MTAEINASSEEMAASAGQIAHTALDGGARSIAYTVHIPSRNVTVNAPVEIDVDTHGGFVPKLTIDDAAGFEGAFKEGDASARGHEYLVAYLPAGDYEVRIQGDSNATGKVRFLVKPFSQPQVGCSSVWVFRGVELSQNFDSNCVDAKGHRHLIYFIAVPAGERVSAMVVPAQARDSVELFANDYATRRRVVAPEVTYSSTWPISRLTLQPLVRRYYELEVRGSRQSAGQFLFTAR